MHSISFFSQLFTFKLQSDVRSLCNYNNHPADIPEHPQSPFTIRKQLRPGIYSAFNFNPDRANKSSNEGAIISSPAFSTSFAHASASAPARW